MTASIRAALVVAVAGCLLTACSVGVDNVIFVTRTNVAVDFDSTPPTASIGYKRDELVLEPRDKNGRVLPVLTTVSTSVKPLKFGANHSFATGDAALVISKYLTSEAELDSVKDDEIKFCDLAKALGSGLEGNEISAEGRKRIVFTTDTSLGLEVDWNAGNLPEAVALGYKRKEFAYVPLTDSEKKDGKLHLSSLIATAHGASQVGAPQDSGIVMGQTFATGFAATLMAAHPAVRRALGPAIVSNYKEIEAQGERLRVAKFQESLASQESLVDNIKAHFNELNDTGKDAVVAEAKRLSLWKENVASTVTRDNFASRIVAAINASSEGRAALLQLLLKFTEKQKGVP